MLGKPHCILSKCKKRAIEISISYFHSMSLFSKAILNILNFNLKQEGNIIRSKIKISVSVLSCNITKYYQVHLPQGIEKGSLGGGFSCK